MSNFNNETNAFGDSQGSNTFDPSNAGSGGQQGMGAGGDGTNALGSGPTDSYGTRQTGNAGTYGQDSLSSGGLGGTKPSDGRGGAAGFDDAGLGSNNNASNAYDDSSSTANTGYGGGNSGGGMTGASQGQGMGGAGGFTGGSTGNSDFRDTTSGGQQPQAGLNQGGDSGDSKVGKLMQKAGQVLNNEKLQQKGQQKRVNQGHDVSSATTVDDGY
jgi:hypothetical protein